MDPLNDTELWITGKGTIRKAPPLTKQPLLIPHPILGTDSITVPLPGMGKPHALARPSASKHKRIIRDARRLANATEAIADFSHTTTITGFTKGQFSLLDLIKAIADRIGPSHFAISTWTAVLAEIGEIALMRKRGKILSAKWLADISLGGRDRGVMQAILHHFGKDSVRVTKNHSKFCLFHNDAWRVVLTSSMNLNMNPRMENYTLAEDPELHNWISDFMAAIWTRQKFDIDNPARHRKEFTDGDI